MKNKMIPKYIFDKQQTLLNNEKISVIDKLIMYRKLLYSDFREKINILEIQKKTLINSYRISIKEIEEEIEKQKHSLKK
jgi:hypothetical protein